MRDLKNPKLIFLKGGLFLLIGIVACALVLVESPRARTALLLVLAMWGFCRAYYFAFYVIQHYVDDRFRFSGLGAFLAWWWRGRE